MENIRVIKLNLVAFLWMGLLTAPFFVVAYDDKTTHPALAQETVALFNLYYPQLALSEEAKQSVMSGDIGEDESARWMNHFYDPIYNRGLWGFSSSKVWALDTKAQAVLDPAYTQAAGVFYAVNQKPFDSRTDYSWDRAIYDYVWHDQKRGLAALGHILHLIQDASVPDHTRNDAHPPVLDLGSPYEHWTKRFTPQTLAGFGASIYQQGIEPPQFRILQQYFHSLAFYSNNNFFSKDTIFDEGYKQPNVDKVEKEKLSNGLVYAFGYKISSPDKWRIVRIDRELGKENSIYSLKDDDHLILTDYWQRLSRQAVVHGVGVMRLFFEEVEKERINKSRWASNQSLADKLFSSLSGVFGNSSPPEPLVEPLPPNALVLVPRGNPEVLGASMEQSVPTAPSNSTSDVATFSIASYPPQTQIAMLPLTGQDSATPGVGAVGSPTSIISSGFVLSPGFVGGGSAPNDENDEHQMFIKNSDNNIQENHSQEGSDEDGANDEDNEEDENAAWEEGNNENVQESDDEDEANGEDVENEENNINEKDNQNSNAGDEVSGDDGESEGGDGDEGNNDNSESVEEQREPLPFSFEILSCANSFVAGDCAVATTSAALTWFSDASTTLSYSILCTFGGVPCDGFNMEQTQATSTVFRAIREGQYRFTARAFNEAGNESETIEREIFLMPYPVVINEIAWGGTAASPNDEWIELYNRSDFSISLDGWVIHTLGNTVPNIPLQGIIAPRAYFLLERTDDNSVSDISTDVMYGNDGPTWALNNTTADQLRLSFASSTVDEVARCNFNRWCGGSGSPSFYTMERVDFKRPGSDRVNWKSALGEFILRGHAANGAALRGTPKTRNSVHYLVSSDGVIAQDTILDARYSPYLIGRNGLTVRSGVTLRVPAGTVIKFVQENEPSLVVEGTFIAEGTEEKPVAITSFIDDKYGGDMNGDGICGEDEGADCPFAGAWKQILFRETSVDSRLEHTIVRYGGRWFSNMTLRAMIAIDRANVIIKNSVFEYATRRAIQLVGSQSVIEDSVFRFNTADADATGIFVGGGSRIINNTFVSNNTGLDVQSGFAEITGNKFLDNLKEAMRVTTLRPMIRDNEGSGNGTDGIVIRGTASAADGPLNIFPNPLPYIIDSGVYTTINVLDGGDLTIKSGAVFRNKNDAIIEVAGTLRVDGQGADDVLFTSLTDSASSTWRGIEVKNTGVLLGNGFTLRYAGVGCRPQRNCAGIVSNNGRVELENARIENNQETGVRLIGSVGSYFNNVSFIGHQKPIGKAVGLTLINSDIGINTLHFTDNAIGVSAANSTVSISDPSSITYSNNLIDAIPMPWF